MGFNEMKLLVHAFGVCPKPTERWKLCNKKMQGREDHQLEYKRKSCFSWTKVVEKKFMFNVIAAEEASSAEKFGTAKLAEATTQSTSNSKRMQNGISSASHTRQLQHLMC
uniref:Uncharacterized protein n=1 Tax=Cucumis melo TaxID=3656 RepID=A0A9I9E6T2_CUCME